MANQPAYRLGHEGEFIIEDYNLAKPFTTFFPGIAGPHGIPMWVFYVNRAQCVCSMGVDDKEHPIMEFLSANRAYQITANQGFRTFIKILRGKAFAYYEPFQATLADAKYRRTQRMIIRPAQLTLEEINQTLGLALTVDYYNIVEDSYAGLVRILRIQNLSRRPARLEGLDGLPLIIPYGVDNYNLKNMRRLVESFVEVTNLSRRVPYFRSKVKQEDRPEVIRVKEGNFYLGWDVNGRPAKLADTLVDPAFIFDGLTDYSYPKRFLERTPYRAVGEQIQENRLPSAMGLWHADIPAGKTFTFASVIGHALSEADVNALVGKVTAEGYLESKQRENAELIERLTQYHFVHTSSPAFDLYARQNFLDNVLRGGFPVTLNADGAKTTLYLYSRKHGDPERDYNDYRLSPTPYSQGNGNFRDVNQNRRNDLFFNPDLLEGNVVHFYNLLQLDGFNPLIVKATTFSIRDGAGADQLLAKAVPADRMAGVRDYLRRRFAPGELLLWLAGQGIQLKINADIFLAKLLALSDKHQETDFGHGYWSDHWEYNLDLLENFLAVYPEKLRSVIWENQTFTFFDNPHRVLPRRDKYVIWDGNPMQLHAVVRDAEKDALIKSRMENPCDVRTQFGQGAVYQTTLLNKLICLAVNKLASLDPEGVGIEMESDKPDWYDALNGLPGQLGSSTNETYELKRTLRFLEHAVQDLKLSSGEQWPVAKEIQEFFGALKQLLTAHAERADDRRGFDFWDAATTAKERFRALTAMGVSGEEVMLSVGELKEFLALALKKIDEGLAKAWAREPRVPYSYFMNRIVDYEEMTQTDADGQTRAKRDGKGLPCFKAKAFKQVPLPLFLEGPVHFLRINHDVDAARALARAIKSSGLYDRKLHMYKVNESLADMPMEIGRTKIFSRGWLENESIWMHMEYKYLLELLRSGLLAEFYGDFKRVFVPFLDPARYGRSILENSSFIASSANPDPAVHGTGFVARLSGSTAEFIHILLHMCTGGAPFTLGAKGELQLKLKPALAAWLFSAKPGQVRLWVKSQWQETAFPANCVSFMFLGSILVTYHNPRRKNTFGAGGVAPVSWTLVLANGKTVQGQGDTIGGELALQVRERAVSKIDIQLG